MDFTGRPMKGMVDIAADGLQDESQVTEWVARVLAYLSDLPPKQK